MKPGDGKDRAAADGAAPLFVCTVAASAALSFAAAAALPSDPGWLAPLGAAAGPLAAGLGLWLIHLRRVVRPARQLAARLRHIRETPNGEAGAETAAPEDPGWLGPLPGECTALADALHRTRRETQAAARAGAADAGGQKDWLASILQTLEEGVFVCTPQHRIMLYNPAALTLAGQPGRVGLARHLGDVLDIAPVGHSLDRLRLRHEAEAGTPEGQARAAPFLCSTRGGETLLRGRMALLTGARGAVTGYVVTLVDGAADHALLAGGDALRRTLRHDLAPALDRLTKTSDSDAAAAAETALETIAEGLAGLMLGHSVMAEIHAADLAELVSRRLAPQGLRLTLTGTPRWLLADSHALVDALAMLAERIAAECGAEEFFLETGNGGERLGLDLSWRGKPLPAAALESLLEANGGADGAAHQGLARVLERHGTRLVPVAGPPGGMAALRLALHRPKTGDASARKRLPPRPEFYDANLMEAHQGDAELAARNLRGLRFVVFDCEMTGLRPDQGDEIVQIAAVPVVRGRVLSGEGMDWIVDPGRPIPPASIRFHGLTDFDVAGHPPIAEVLPEFRTFAGDAVLVAHNAAFDLRFIARAETAAGVSFDACPVLDTMLVSRLLDGGEAAHSLDALCDRYGIAITGRHTALGDTIATAELLVRMIDRLEARGLATFGAVMRATNMEAALRHRRNVIAHGTGTGG